MTPPPALEYSLAFDSTLKMLSTFNAKDEDFAFEVVCGTLDAAATHLGVTRGRAAAVLHLENLITVIEGVKP